MRKLFLSLVFLSVLLSIHANPGIKGIVIDQTTRKALDYAHVVLYDGNHIVEEAMTEANGSFLIQPVKPGTYSIRIHFLGYDGRGVYPYRADQGSGYYPDANA